MSRLNKNNLSKGFAHLFLIVVIVVLTIGGILYFSWQKGLIKTLPSQDNSPTPNGVVDETANWKTYVYNRCNLSVKYPPNWILYHEPTGAIFGAATIHSYHEGYDLNGNDWLKLQIGCGDLNPGESPEQALERLSSRDSGYGVSEIQNRIQTLIDGKVTYKQINLPPVGRSVIEYYIFPAADVVVNLGFTPSDTTLTGEIDQILSTFRFLDNNQNSLECTYDYQCGYCTDSYPEKCVEGKCLNGTCVTSE